MTYQVFEGFGGALTESAGYVYQQMDEAGGPNHVKNFCDAPFLYDMEKRELIRKNTADYLWHFTHFIEAGAVRIGMTNYSDKLEATAFLNPDHTMAVVLLNRSGESIRVNIRAQEELTEVEVEPESIVTGIISSCR